MTLRAGSTEPIAIWGCPGTKVTRAVFAALHSSDTAWAHCRCPAVAERRPPALRRVRSAMARRGAARGANSPTMLIARTTLATGLLCESQPTPDCAWGVTIKDAPNPMYDARACVHPYLGRWRLAIMHWSK
jgi:hypothetical protein